MPSPSTVLTTLRPELSTFFQYDYLESESMFIGSRIMPLMPVPKQAGKYGLVTLESLAKHGQVTNRAPGAGYNRDRYEFTDDSYSTEEHGLEEVLDDRQVAMYMDYFSAEMVATRRLVNKILTARERRIAAATQDVTYYTGASSRNQAVTNGNWDVAGSTPIDDVELAVRKHRDNTGMMPNLLQMNLYTFRDLRLNQQIRERITAVGAGFPERASDVTTTMLEAVFDLPVAVAGGMYNSANPNASATMTDIWANHAMVMRVATDNDMMNPAFGRTMHWTDDDSEIDGHIETYREEQTRSEIIRGRHDTDEKIHYKDLAIMIPNVRG